MNSQLCSISHSSILHTASPSLHIEYYFSVIIFKLSDAFNYAFYETLQTKDEYSACKLMLLINPPCINFEICKKSLSIYLNPSTNIN